MNNTSRIFALVIAISVLIGAYEIGSGFYLLQTTGILQVTSADNQATVSVSQLGKQPVNLTSADATLRLKPGSYEVIASDGKSQITKSAVIYAKQTTNLNIPQPISTIVPVPTNVQTANQLIQNLLPFTGPDFSWKVTYSYTFNASYAVPTIDIIAPTNSAQQAAVAWIQGQGYNPANLGIVYVDATP